MDESNQDLAVWQKVKDALDQAFERSPEQRRQCLEQLCDDRAVLDQALSVLEAYESAADSSSAEPSATELSAESPTATSDGVDPRTEVFGSGSEVGPYRIDRKLGAGGMGAVYLAHRSDRSYDKEVAIKLIHQKWAISKERISRFRRERQILANLSHPSIAQLLDGGSTSQGYPYLVMEYVEGETIDAYRDSRDLSVDEVLDLFQQICSAVQYAHQNLIVHRDLKPANILVDADGQVKLLDFGIAKILDTEDFGVTVLETRTGSSPMTLAYASPEQVSGGAITTATDVYALGILLFQLLTGQKAPSVRQQEFAGGRGCHLQPRSRQAFRSFAALPLRFRRLPVPFGFLAADSGGPRRHRVEGSGKGSQPALSIGRSSWPTMSIAFGGLCPSRRAGARRSIGLRNSSVAIGCGYQRRPWSSRSW